MSVEYVTLMASLPPHLPNLFATKQTPLSRINLDERLLMLNPEDTIDLAVIENLVHWDRMAIDTTDEEMLKRGIQAENQLKNEFIKEIIRWRLESRTFMAALRRRHLGKSTLYASSKWGYGRWMKQIEMHWKEPAFGLDLQHPWLIDANRFLQEDNFLGLERLLLGRVWDHYGRVAGDHYFDFEAVVVYVLRWDVIDRWSRYNTTRAEKRFNEMAASSLGEYANIFA